MSRTVKWEHKSDPRMDDRPRKEERRIERLLNNAQWYFAEYSDAEPVKAITYEPADQN